MLVSSMWRGYEKEPQVAELIELFTDEHSLEKPLYVHASGHASIRTLSLFIRHISPKKLLCVHSEGAQVITKVSGNTTEVVTDDTVIL